jgi:hypothetical protein
MRSFAAAVGFSMLMLSWAVADDAQPDLDKAKKTYEKAVADARAALIKGFETAETSVRNRSGLAAEKKVTLLKDIASEKESFVDGGKLPDLGETISYATEYKDSMGRADRALMREYDKLIESHSKKGEMDKATSLLAEKKAFELDSVIRQNRAEYSSLLGRWSVEIPQVPFKAEWTISADGTVNSTDGNGVKGKWKHDKDRRRIVVTWEEVKIVNWLAYPIKPDGTTAGGTSQDRKYQVIATKIK